MASRNICEYSIEKNKKHGFQPMTQDEYKTELEMLGLNLGGGEFCLFQDKLF